MSTLTAEHIPMGEDYVASIDWVLLESMSRTEPSTVSDLCKSWVYPRARALLVGRLNSLARRDLVVHVGPGLWRRSWTRAWYETVS